MTQNIPEIYGSLVFNDRIMRSKLPKDMYKALKKTIENGTHLELDVANSVAVAMKEWAIENGATHYMPDGMPLLRLFMRGGRHKRKNKSQPKGKKKCHKFPSVRTNTRLFPCMVFL